MGKALVIYGSTTGNTQIMADIVGKSLQHEGFQVRIVEVTEASTKDLTDGHDVVVLGCPAYGDEEIELQEDFAEFYEKMDGLDLAGSKFGVFAPGDSSYTHFCGSVDMIADKLISLGGTLLGEGLKVEGDSEDAEDEIADWVAAIARSL